MKPNPLHRLPAPLEAAVQRLKLAARDAAERTIESLGLAALASTNAFHRDGLLGAQFELNRKSAVFVLTFNEAFDQRVLRELGPRGAGDAAAAPAPVQAAATDWAALSLVEDKEVEAQISADRFGMEIAHACEWELRELEGYVSSLLGDAGGERDRNPLRPDIVGHAMIRGIEAVSDRPEIRKVLSSELSRSLGALLPQTYADIVAELRNAGVRPLGLAVRQRSARGAAGAGGDAGDDGHDAGASDFAPGARSRSGHSHHGLDSHHGVGSRRAGATNFASSTRGGGFGTRGGGLGTHPGGHGPHGGAPLGRVDPALMSLIRRLAYTDSGPGPRGEAPDSLGEYGASPPSNLIRAHREELREAAGGALDHMVIDVIGFLFDQILADPKVPPQMARQIARLQLPVLRAALGDPSFFSSRRHPVRRFVNRIASLGSAFEDYGEEAAQRFLAKVKALIHEVVEGDFEQIDIYEQKLAALEAFTAELASGEGAAAAALVSEKEDQQRLRQLYAQRLAGDLKDLAAPAFLRDFLSGVWSQVLLRAAEQGGPDGPRAQRLRGVGRELFLSVQPKATPAHRKAFLAELPKLMQDLTEGMNLVAWPEAERRAFFGQLMPAHAEALKSAGGRQLEINLMARQVEGALQRPPPSREDLRTAPPQGDQPLPPVSFSAEEAQRLGLVQESAIDWSQKVEVDIDLSTRPGPETGAEPASSVSLPGLPSLAAGGEPAEPTEGRALADHVQVGFAYQMHLDGQWQRVRLSHVSAARSFFIFSHGARHKKTISLTQRMLQKLCETGRLKAYEQSYLIERATERARRQLSALGGAQSA